MRARNFIGIILILILASAMSFASGTTATTDEFPVKITSQHGRPQWNDYPDNPVAQEIRKRINVEIETIRWTSETRAAMMASGDLPDIFITEASDGKMLIESGYVLALDDLVEEHAPNLLKTIGLGVEFSKRFWSLDTGKLYGIPGGGHWEPVFYYGKTGFWNLNVRWSYYKELGAPPIRNEEDLLDVVEAMVKAHPTTEDGKRVYGIPVSYADFNAYSIPFMAIYGYTSVFTRAMVSKVETSELVDNYTNPDGPTWRLVKFYFKQNQRGIFDEDSLVIGREDLKAKAANGQYVANLRRDIHDPANAIFQQAGEPDGYIQPPMAWEGMGNWGGGDWRYGYQNARWVSSKAKRPDKVMEFIDFAYSYDGCRILMSGVEGVHWDMKGGKPVVRQETLDLNAAGGPAWMATGIAHFDNLLGYTTAHPGDGEPIGLFLAEDVFIKALNPLDKDYSEYFGVRYPAEKLFQTIEEYNQITQAPQDNRINNLLPPMPDDLKRKHSTCDSILMQAFPRAILAENEAEFNAIQNQAFKDLKAAGFDEIKEWYLKNWKEIREMLGPKAK